MRNIFLLVMAMLKGNGVTNLGGDRAKKPGRLKLGSKGSWIFLAFVAVYMGGLAVMYVQGGYSVLKPLGLQSLILGLAISVVAFMVFFLGLFYVMSVFYFSSDIEKLLPLPIRPGELLAAKFIVTLAYEYLITLTMLLPAMVMYGVLEQCGVLYYVYMTIGILLLPVVPLVFASVLIMLIMRLAPAARNKDRFTMFSSIFAVAVGVGVSFGMQSLLSRSESANFGEVLSKSADQISRLSSGIFPGTYFINYALAKPTGWDSFGMMAIFVAITAIAALALYELGNLLYFKGVIGIAGAGSKSKKLTKTQFEESTASGSAFITCVKKDILVLFRTPIFFMNNVLVMFLMPLFMLLPMFANASSSSSDGFNMASLRAMASAGAFTGDYQNAGYILLGFFGFITFLCGTNGISESAISREGNCAYLMKIIPMSYRDQVWAKITVGILLSLLSALLILGIFTVVLMPPLWFVLLCLLTVPGAILLPNIAGILFDLYMPKIRWDNEQKAVKQNMNVLYGIFLSMLVIGLIAAGTLAIPLPFAGMAAIIVGVPLALSAVSAVIVNKVASRTMLELAA